MNQENKNKSNTESENQELKYINDCLKESTEKINFILDSTNIGLWEWNIQTGEININNRWAKIIGYEAKELMPFSLEKFYSLCNLEDLPDIEGQLKNFISGNASEFDVDFRIKHKSGHWRWVHYKGKVFKRDENGRPLILMGIQQDVTKRKSLEEKFKTIFENNATPTAIIEKDMRISLVNEAYCKMSGYSREEATSRKWTENIPKADLQKLVELNKKRIQDPSLVPGSYQLNFIIKDGSIRHGLVHVSVIHTSKKMVVSFLDITKQKEAEKALLKSEMRLKTAQMIAHIGNWELDPKTMKIWLSDESIEILGLEKNVFKYSLEYIIGLLTNPENKNIKSPEEIEKLAQADFTKFKEEFQIRRPNDGEMRILDIITDVIFSADGSPEKIIGIIHDITDQKKVLQSLQESEEIHRLMFETSQEGILIAQDMKLVYFNPMIKEVSGYNEEELKNIDFIDIIHPDDKKFVLENYLKRINEEFVDKRYEFRFIRKDGSTRWVTMTGAKLNWNGRPASFNFITDIHDQKDALEKLSLSEEKYRLITENTSDVIWVMNFDKKKLTYISPAIKPLRGLTVKEALEEDYSGNKSSISNRKLIIFLEKDVNKFIKNKTNNYFIEEIQQEFKDGHLIWVEISCRFNFNKYGELEVIGVSRNIEERKRMEAAILKNARKLKDLIATKDKFFSIISHDLRNPIVTLIGMAQMMADEKADFSKEEYLDLSKYFYSTSTATLGLLENLLQWSKLQMNGMQFFPEQIKVEEFFKSCDVSTLEMAKKKSVRLEMNCQPGITVTADENMLHSVLRNLVTNAIKFSHRGGTVKIGAERLGEKVKFSVSDNGIGIDKERIMKLFRIDANVSRPGTENEPSTGLGLILCKDFVEKHHGDIWAESKENEGTTFFFTIPKIMKSEEINIPIGLGQNF